jgi:DNA-binding winged helix-turn-helix (wHTH) protein
VRIDLNSGVIWRNGKSVNLSATEHRLLQYLFDHRARAVDRQELLTEVWGYSPKAVTRTVDVTISRLRRKLEPDPAKPKYLVTERWQGYRLFTQGLVGIDERQVPSPTKRETPLAQLEALGNSSRSASELVERRFLSFLGLAG